MQLCCADLYIHGGARFTVVVIVFVLAFVVGVTDVKCQPRSQPMEQNMEHHVRIFRERASRLDWDALLGCPNTCW